jgi:hypothetical protein
VELEMRLTERTLSVASGVLQVDKEYDGTPFLGVLFIGVKEEPGEEIRVRPRMLFCICEDIGDSGGGSSEGFIMVGSNSFISLLWNVFLLFRSSGNCSSPLFSDEKIWILLVH